MIPLHVTCLADLIGIAVRRQPRAVAIEHEHGRLTYAEFWERTRRCASALRALGLESGDRVVVFADNAPEYLELYVGLQRAGLVAVPANYRLVGDELAYLARNSRASAIVV